MAGRDNVLFKGTFASGASASTVVPLSLAYGIENVRQGLGTPVLKNVRAYFVGGYTSFGIPIEIKNSNWVDSAGLMAQLYSSDTALNRNSLNFMRGRDKVLIPNTAWTINATLPSAASSAGEIYVLLEIEYSDVGGINTENAAGSPVMKTCTNTSVTAATDTVVSIGTFDNLLQGVSYVLSEVSITGGYSSPMFVLVEGFTNQKGLCRIIPVKSTGLADQIEGSVVLTKQTYNLSILSYTALSAASISVNLEMIASAN